MLVRAILTTSAILTVSLHVELAGARRFPFACCGEMLVTSAGVSSAVRMGIMGGRGTLVGADSSVVARTTGGDRVTNGIIVDKTLVGV